MKDLKRSGDSAVGLLVFLVLFLPGKYWEDSKVSGSVVCVCCVSLSMVVAGSWCSLMTATPSTAGPKSCIKCTIRVSTFSCVFFIFFNLCATALLVCCLSFIVMKCSMKYCTKRHVVQGFLAIEESVVQCFKGKSVVQRFKWKSVVQCFEGKSVV